MKHILELVDRSFHDEWSDIGSLIKIITVGMTSTRTNYTTGTTGVTVTVTAISRCA